MFKKQGLNESSYITVTDEVKSAATTSVQTVASLGATKHIEDWACPLEDWDCPLGLSLMKCSQFISYDSVHPSMSIIQWLATTGQTLTRIGDQNIGFNSIRWTLRQFLHLNSKL